MALFDIFRKKTMSASTYELVNGINEAFVEDSGTNAVQNAYGINAYVKIAVDKIAKNVSRSQLQLIQNDNILESGPAYQLFNDVNPYMSRYQLWEASVSWLKIAGEYFWAFGPEYNGVSLPKEIYVLNPRRMTHVLNKERTKIVLWKYKDPDRQVEIPFYPGEIIHMRDWNPWSTWRGCNPLVSAAMNISQDAMIDASSVSLLKNKSTPSGLLSTEQPLTETQAQEYILRWEKRHSGSKRSGRVAVLGNNLKYQAIGLTPEEMQYLEAKKWNRSTIMSTYGVPPAVAGFRDDETPLSGTDTKEQLTQFWNQTLIPIIRQIEDKMSTDFQRRWTPTIKYQFNIQNIPELQEDRDTEIERQGKQIADGRLTINEVREMEGRDPVPWGDTWYKPVSMVSVDEPTKYVPAPSDPGKMQEFFTVKQPDYLPQYKYNQWLELKNRLEPFERGLAKAIDDVMYNQRCTVLDAIAADKELPDVWERAKESIYELAESTFPALIDIVENTMPDTVQKPEVIIDAPGLFRERAAGMAGIIDEVKKELSGCKDADHVRTVYNRTKHVVKDLCRVETMHIVNTMRMAVYNLNGFKQHEYVGSMENMFNPLNGSVATIGRPFSNGKTIPYSKDERNFSLPVIASKKKSYATDHRDEIYEPMYKEMREDEKEIEDEVAAFWVWVGIELNKLDETGKIEWLKRTGLGEELLTKIEPPINNTFSRGLKKYAKPSPERARILYQQYLDSRATILAESGSKVSTQIIDDVLSGQFSKEELAERISKTVGTKVNNAGTVAQTETTAAYNEGLQRSIDESDYKYKQWFHAGGGKVDRPHHMFDEIVPKDQYFTLLNGVQMFKPGDGPIEEVANCHCVVIPVETLEG